MSERLLAEISCDGDEKIGYGHIRRSLTLMTQLERDGFDVRVKGLSERARRWLPIPKFPGRTTDIQIFDLPCGINEQIQAAQMAGQMTVALDWFGETLPDVNIAVYPHGEVRGLRKVYHGFEYVLIREEVALLRRSPEVHGSKRVVVVLGGGDLLGQGHEAACHLCRQGLEVILVQGPLANKRGSGEGYEVLINPSNLPQLLASTDWVVTNGGGCMFEAMCLGKATVVLPQTETEMRIARFAKDRDALLGIGLDCLHLFQATELEKIAERGFELIDGRGASRVSAIIRDLV